MKNKVTVVMAFGALSFLALGLSKSLHGVTSRFALKSHITTSALLKRTFSTLAPRPTHRRLFPYAGIATGGTALAYMTAKKSENRQESNNNSTHTPPKQEIPSPYTVPWKLKCVYKAFQDGTSTVHTKPRSGKFNSRFEGIYPENAPIATANDEVATLGFPTTECHKKYEKLKIVDNNQTKHTIRLSGHIQCMAGDTECDNALLALSSNQDFEQCMHYALSHPEIPRTQQCQSLFSTLGRYGPGDQPLEKPLCNKAWWKFDVTLDRE